MREEERPSLIRVQARSSASPSPNKQGTSKAHGAPLGEDEVRADQGGPGLGPRRSTSSCPTASTSTSARRARRRAAGRVGRALRVVARRERRAARRSGTPRGAGRPLPGVARGAARTSTGARTSSPRARPARRRWPRSATYVPTMVGGAADLSESTKTEFPGGARAALHARAKRPQRVLRRARARHGRRGQRHGRPRRDRAPLRLDVPAVRRLHARRDPPEALTGLQVAWVYTHDSVGLGEDGPTHQPVEHLAALRAIPGLVVLRPGDANETARGVARRSSRTSRARPCSSSRARTCRCSADASDEGVAQGAYVLRERRATRARGDRRTGSEVCGRDRGRGAAGRRRDPRRASSRCRRWELFDAAGRRLPRRRSCRPSCRRVSVEAGVSQGWSKCVDASVSHRALRRRARRAQVVLEKLGITPDATVDKVRQLLAVVA